jgi:hypothetical protein
LSDYVFANQRLILSTEAIKQISKKEKKKEKKRVVLKTSKIKLNEIAYVNLKIYIKFTCRSNSNPNLLKKRVKKIKYKQC